MFIESNEEIQWKSQEGTNKYKIIENTTNKSEKMSFWSNAPPFQSSMDSIDIGIDPINKFIIERIEMKDKAKILYGSKQVAVVSGIFSETEFKIGQKVGIFPCLCCDFPDQTGARECYSKDACSVDEIIYRAKMSYEYKVNCENRSNTQDLQFNSIDPSNTQYSNPLNGINTKYSSADNQSKTIFEISDQSKVIIIEDDVLTVTSFCNAFECINNPLLKSLIVDLSFVHASPSIALGIIIHKIIQNCLLSKQSSFLYITNEAKKIINLNLILLYSCNISEKEALNEILKYLKNIMKFLSMGLAVDSVEHKVYSSVYGLKGNIDCLDVDKVIEIKTGKCLRVEHRSQTVLYSILMKEQSIKQVSEDSRNTNSSNTVRSSISGGEIQMGSKVHVDRNLTGSCIANRMISVNPIESNISSSRMDFNQNGCKSYYKTYSPVLYYVHSDNYQKMCLNHLEIINLLKLRNDIACNKELSNCECDEDHCCKVLNRIKGLNTDHFLKIQYEAIELEARENRSFFKGVKLKQVKEKIIYKFITTANTPFNTNEYVYVHSINYKFICIGIVDQLNNGETTIILRENINLDKIIMVCNESNATCLKFMRWSLVNVAYKKYLINNASQSGIDLFSLPNQELGLNDKDEVSGFDFLSDDFDHTSDKQPRSSDRQAHIGILNKDKLNSNRSNENVTAENIPDENLMDSLEDFTSASETALNQFSFKSKFIEDLFSSASLDASIEVLRNDSSDENPPRKRASLGSFSDESSIDEFLDSSVEISDIKLSDELSIDISLESSVDAFATKFDLTVDAIPDKVVDAMPSKVTSAGESRSHSMDLSFSTLSNHPTSQKPKIAFNHSADLYFGSTDLSSNSPNSIKFQIPEIFKEDFLKLNENQRSALFLSLNTPSYRIVHGMPGTGKSTLISLLIKILIHYNKRVLLVCYTHLAIENILKKLDNVNYYRAKREDPTINSKKTYEELKEFMNGSDLVVGTCFSFTDPIYISRRFDYCIIDEGSQLHLLLSLIPISLCDRFCIVGDHLQLKPLSKRSKDLTLSLFEYLLNLNKVSAIEDSKCSVLSKQYRMGDSIMRLSNILFYNNKLVGIGKNSTVEFIDSENIDYSSFIKSLNQKCTILCYLNSKVNETTQYTSNVVTTIDKFQGSEDDEIVVVFDPVEVCDVLKSRERLNVALTRARTVLKLVGNRKRMLEIPVFRELLNLV